MSSLPILQEPHHPGKKSRQIVGIEDQRVVMGSQLGSYPRCIDEFLVIGPITRAEGVDLLVSGNVSSSCCHHRRVEASAK
jgi:hypothetical protein